MLTGITVHTLWQQNQGGHVGFQISDAKPTDCIKWDSRWYSEKRPLMKRHNFVAASCFHFWGAKSRLFGIIFKIRWDVRRPTQSASGRHISIINSAQGRSMLCTSQPLLVNAVGSKQPGIPTSESKIWFCNLYFVRVKMRCDKVKNEMISLKSASESDFVTYRRHKQCFKPTQPNSTTTSWTRVGYHKWYKSWDFWIKKKVDIS